MQLSFSRQPKGVIGIVGHAGAGHANSHCGFIQDDSGGLTTVTALLKRMTGLDLTIVEVKAEVGQKGSFTVKTACGGTATSSPRRGVTPYEAQLVQRIVGQEAICSQTLAMTAFGRMLGQGAMEAPVALQSAIANAAIDSFVRNYPDRFLTGDEGVQGNEGRFLSTVIDVNAIPVSLMGLLNATSGGLGPNEDVEGNVNLAGKADVMSALGLDRIPTIVVEGKVCADPVSKEIDCPTFVTRAYPGDDNTTVSTCLEEAAQSLGYPIVYPKELLARQKGALRALTQKMGDELVALAKAFGAATTSREKVRLAAEINRFASEDLGGVTFMSDDVHEIMGGVGMIPGVSGVLSLFISRKELAEKVYPALSLEDAQKYVDVILKTVELIDQKYGDAMREIENAASRAREHHLVVR